MNLQNSDHIQLKAFANPLRLRMMAHFSEPRTVKQVADIMGIRPHTLYHHIGVLEQCGVVKLLRRVKLHGSIEEKYYKLTERYLRGAGTLSLISGDMKYAVDAVMAVVDEYKQSIKEKESIPGYVCQRRIQIRSGDFDEIRKHLDKGIEELCEVCLKSFEDPDGDATFIINLLGFLK